MEIPIGYIISFVFGFVMASCVYFMLIAPLLKRVHKSEWMKRALKSKSVDAWEAGHNMVVDEDTSNSGRKMVLRKSSQK